MKDYPDIVKKIGVNWFIVDIDIYSNFKYGDGTKVKRFGPFPNEATARLAELAFFQGLNNELQKVPGPQ